jgi:AcrR family transcriptional regulator
MGQSGGQNMKKGVATRERLMDIAEAAVLQKGFGATSIEELIAATGITKSGFFYHFKDKNALAHALLERHLARDEAILDGVFNQARHANDDPLQVFLTGLGLLADLLRDLPGGHPGCLVATYCYNERLFDRRTQDLNRQGAQNWRRRFADMFAEIDALHGRRDDGTTPEMPTPEMPTPEMLADMISSVIEGGIILAKVLREPQILAQQILLLRAFVQSTYRPTSPASAMLRFEAGDEIGRRRADMLG